MPSPEHVRQVIGEWIEKAEHNLKAAHCLLDLGEDWPAEMVCFHAQQGVEMYLKAILVQAGTPVPKTHDVEKIVALMPLGIRISLSVEEMRLLTGHAVEHRYPGYGPVTLSEAQEAVRLADGVRDEVRSILL